MGFVFPLESRVPQVNGSLIKEFRASGGAPPNLDKLVEDLSEKIAEYAKKQGDAHASRRKYLTNTDKKSLVKTRG